MSRSLFLATCAILAMTDPSDAADKRPMKIDDLFAFKRVADPQVSPDGSQVVYQVTEITDPANNKKHTHLWLAATDGKTPPRQLTGSVKSDTHPRWSPDGSKILFESNRAGTSQLYVLDLKDGGEAKKVTNISTGAGTGIWSPDGCFVAFVSAVYPEFSTLPFSESDKKNAEKEKAIEDSPVKAKTFEKLFFRHWDSFVDGKRQHLFVQQVALRKVDKLKADGTFPYGEPHDCTPGDRDAYPTSTTFSVGDDFTFTPHSLHLVFTAVPAKGESWSTNHDLCRVSITNKSTEWETLTKDNPAADCSPKFSPDGKKLAWRAQKKAGYEADKWDINIVKVNSNGSFESDIKIPTSKKDISVDEFIWLTSDRLAFSADSEGGKTIFECTDGVTSTPAQVDLIPVTYLAGSGSVSGLNIQSGGDPSRGAKVVCFQMSSMNSPAEVFSFGYLPNDPTFTTQKTAHNRERLAELDLSKPATVKVPVEGGDMQMWVLKPPGFDAAKKWPVVYLVHGGPQGAWEDAWSFRWNAQTWAAKGYIVVMPNPRGSTGFGQKFVDEISGDWGGKCYRDLVAGLEYVKKQPYVDTTRLASAGGSFGGYMQNWFATSDVAKEFKCLITHCSVYNFESMWGTTDELWFDEYEHGGLPWEIPGKYREFSPHVKAGNLSKYKVPMLIIHNDLDFRCPIGQGHELFSALQRQGVPSRFVNFPDEGHWVLKPANSKRWHEEVFGWLDKYCPPGGK